MQLDTDEHWYSVLGFLYNQQTPEQKLEIIEPHTRDSFLEEIFKVLKNATPNETLKVNLLISLEENIDFFFDDKSRMQRAIAVMCELLNLPYVGPGTFTSSHVKCQLLTTLTTLLIECDLIHLQPAIFESVVSIILGLVAQAAESLQELNNVYSGILNGKLGQLLIWAQEEKTHAHQSYLMLFSSVFVSSIQILLRVFNVLYPNDPTSQQLALNEEEVASYEAYASDLLGTKLLMNKDRNSSSPANSAGSASEGLTLKLFDAPKPQQLQDSSAPSAGLDNFSLPLSPPYLAKTLPLAPAPVVTASSLSRKTSTLLGSSSSSVAQALKNQGVGFEPLVFCVYISRRTPANALVNLMRKDIRRAVVFMLDNLNAINSCEALRLMAQLSYLICETQAVAANELPADFTSSSVPAGTVPLAARYSSKTLGAELPVRRGEAMDELAKSSSSSSLKGSFSAVVINADTFSSSYKPLLRSYSSLLWHVVALANLAAFANQPSPDPSLLASTSCDSTLEQLRENLALVVHRHFETMSIEFRLMHLEWLFALSVPMGTAPSQIVAQPTLPGPGPGHPRQFGTAANSSKHKGTSREQHEQTAQDVAAGVLYKYRHHFFPSPFDSLPIIAAKLNALSFCYDSSKGSKFPPPTDLLNAFQLLNDFTKRGPNSEVTDVVFRTLELYLRKFPELFDDIFGLIKRSVLKAPALSVCLMRTIGHLHNSNDRRDLANFRPFVQRVADMLTSAELPPPQLENFLELMLSITSYDFIDPTGFLTALLRFLRCTDGLCSKGDWQVGHSILSIINAIFLTHDTKPLFSALREVLQFVELYYGDIEIRDRAHFYYQLLTHVPAEKVCTILSFKSSDENDLIGQVPATPSRREGTLPSGFSLSEFTPSSPSSPQSPGSPLEGAGIGGTPLPPITPMAGSAAAAFLQLTRLHPHYNFNSLESLMTHYNQRTDVTASPPTDSLGEASLLENYRSQLAKTSANPEIKLTYILTFKKPWVTSGRGKHRSRAPTKTKEATFPSGVPLSLYSINLEFTPNGIPAVVAAAIQPVSIPYLAATASAEAKGRQTVDYGNIPSTESEPSTAQQSPRPTGSTEEAGPVASASIQIPPKSSGDGSPILGSRSAEFSDDLDTTTSGDDASPHKEESAASTGLSSDLARSRGKFPAAYALLLKLKPGLPLPGSFSVTATYNSDQGRVHELRLEPLALQLSDMFLPLSVDPSVESNVDVYARRLFTALWAEFEAKSASTDPAPRISLTPKSFLSSNANKSPVGTIPTTESTASVKFIQLPAAQVAIKLRNHLAPFIINPTSLDKLVEELQSSAESLLERQENIDALIVLPSHYHLLLKFQIASQHTIIAIQTDFWRCLAFVDGFFEKVFQRLERTKVGLTAVEALTEAVVKNDTASPQF